MHTLFPQTLEGRIEFSLVLFHEIETATFDDGGQPLRRHDKLAKINDLADASLQVARQFLVGQEQDVRVAPVLPPAMDVLEPGAVLDLATHEPLEKLGEGSLIAYVRAVEMIIRNHHVPPLAGDINVPARSFWDRAIGQVALESPRRRAGFKSAG